MDKKKFIIYLIFVSIIFIWLLSYFYVFNWNNQNQKENLYDILIKNNSWNTPFLDTLPYKKNEELQLNIIFPWESKNKITLDLDKINKKINIKKIFIDEKEINKDNIVIENWESIKIIWEAIWDGILKKEDLIDIIKNIENIKEEKKEEQKITWNIDIKFDKKVLNSNINNLIEITWSGKEFIKYVNIWEISLTPIHVNNKTFLTISKNTFNSWEYFTIVQLQNNELITLNEKIIFHYEQSKVNIANITPNYIKNDIDRNIVLQWNGFSKIISLQLNNNTILKNTSFQIINDNVITVLIPKDLDVWNYYFNIMTVDWINELKNNIFTINN